ncbi:MAG: hypothetical protein JW810_01780 [Sedimentisphaerales bacterium]|nr:hypothetical protein [Sedimentisphaerales bacterium]
MIGVDLIPDECKISHQRRRRLRIWAAVCLAGFALAGVSGGALYLLYRQESRVTREIALRHEQVQQDIERLDRQKRQLDSWESQLVLLAELGRYVDYVSLTAFLSDHSPRRVYLEQLLFSEPQAAVLAAQAGQGPGALPKAAGMFQIHSALNGLSKQAGAAGPAKSAGWVMYLKGRALDYAAVADYLSVLRQAPQVHRADLLRTWRASGTQADRMRPLHFEMECLLAGPRPTKGETYADMPPAQNF